MELDLTDKRGHALTRGRGVTAAQRAFNSHGGGSNPSGPNDQNYRPVAQRSEPAP